MFPISKFLVFPVVVPPLADIDSLDTKHHQVPDQQSRLERKRSPFPQELYENRSLDPGRDWPETGFECDEYPSLEGKLFVCRVGLVTLEEHIKSAEM